MSALHKKTHGENLLSNFNFNNQDEYIKNLKKKDMGVKIYFNDGSILKGMIVKLDKFNFYLLHKNNILMILKSNVKFIEPLPPLKNK